MNDEVETGEFLGGRERLNLIVRSQIALQDDRRVVRPTAPSPPHLGRRPRPPARPRPDSPVPPKKGDGNDDNFGSRAVAAP